jgi:hypothetical protein
MLSIQGVEKETHLFKASINCESPINREKRFREIATIPCADEAFEPTRG